MRKWPAYYSLFKMFLENPRRSFINKWTSMTSRPKFHFKLRTEYHKVQNIPLNYKHLIIFNFSQHFLTFPFLWEFWMLSCLKKYIKRKFSRKHYLKKLLSNKNNNPQWKFVTQMKFQFFCQTDTKNFTPRIKIFYKYPRRKKSTRGCYGKVGNPKNFYNNIKRMSSNFMLERRKRITHREEFKEITLYIFVLHPNIQSVETLCELPQIKHMRNMKEKALSLKNENNSKVVWGWRTFHFSARHWLELLGVFIGKRLKKLFNSFILANSKWKSLSKKRNRKSERNTNLYRYTYHIKCNKISKKN